MLGRVFAHRYLEVRVCLLHNSRYVSLPRSCLDYILAGLFFLVLIGMLVGVLGLTVPLIDSRGLRPVDGLSVVVGQMRELIFRVFLNDMTSWVAGERLLSAWVGALKLKHPSVVRIRRARVFEPAIVRIRNKCGHGLMLVALPISAHSDVSLSLSDLSLLKSKYQSMISNSDQQEDSNEIDKRCAINLLSVQGCANLVSLNCNLVKITERLESENNF